MKLRRWQEECVRLALSKYLSGNSHFLCLATPGAGKTIMAADLARQLWDQGKIDLVVCLSPSVNVAYDFRKALETRTDFRFDGALGAHGCSMTYQAMLSMRKEFWKLFDQHRIMVIFDEIHHCAGQELMRANSWGQKIIQEIQGRAAYTLALTGTPWRSDRIPICLSSYCKEGKIHCDYSYGLREAVNDRVCRLPKITLVDNDNIHVDGEKQATSFDSISALLASSACSYQTLIENEALVSFILKTADQILSALRRSNAGAGGLIVASNVLHAHKIVQLLKKITGETACVVTYHSDDPQYLIERYKVGQQKWIVSVGMISEGTNIPRLQVCCHLTRVQTEMHFRQVLGRVLRQTSAQHEFGHLIIPATAEFMEFSKRIADEIPSSAVAELKLMSGEIVGSGRNNIGRHFRENDSSGFSIRFGEKKNRINDTEPTIRSINADIVGIKQLHIFGRYRTELLSLIN